MARSGHRGQVVRLAWVLLPCLLLLLAGSARAEEVVETRADGSVWRRYGVDEEGRRHGVYVELFADGETAVRTRYRHGELNGVHQTFHENGRKARRSIYRVGRVHGTFEEWAPDGHRTYKAKFRDDRRDGKVEAWLDDGRELEQIWEAGALVRYDGVLAFPRGADEIGGDLRTILDAGDRGALSDAAWSERRALARLRAYRYLCGVPWEDLVLDEGCTQYATAASRICAAIGDIMHEPPNPGWPPDEYAFAAEGASRCNLHQEHQAFESVDGYMDDSDKSNIAAVGHRCWCLNPAMAKTGFGEWKAKDGQFFTAMYAMDDSRGKVPRLDAVCYPARGWMPLAMFGARHAWSVQLDPRDYTRLDPGRVKVTLRRLNGRYLPEDAPLEIDFFKVNTDAEGLPICVIFRPADLVLKEGDTFSVRLSGLDKRAKPGKDVVFQYVVRFYSLGN